MGREVDGKRIGKIINEWMDGWEDDSLMDRGMIDRWIEG